jgi:hypothetical protein
LTLANALRPQHHASARRHELCEQPLDRLAPPRRRHAIERGVHEIVTACRLVLERVADLELLAPCRQSALRQRDQARRVVEAVRLELEPAFVTDCCGWSDLGD